MTCSRASAGDAAPCYSVEMRVIAAVMVLAWSGLASAKPVKIGIDMGNGTLVVTFDPKKISEADVRAAAALSPHAPHGVITDSLSSCRDQAGALTACGSKPHTPAKPEFFRDADTTVKLNRARVKELADQKVAKQLEPAKEWLRRQAAFFAGLEERKLAYFRSWKSADLAGTIEGIDGTKECAGAIAKLDAAKTHDQKFQLAQYDWHNCMNERGHAVMGEFPEAPWKAFLKVTGVKARFELQEGD